MQDTRSRYKSQLFFYIVLPGCGVRSCSVSSDSLPPHKAPLSMGFPRQEYWSGLPFPSPGDLPNPGVELVSLTSPALQEKQEMGVPSLGWEDPLEKGMTTHSSILAWGIPWIEKPSGLQFMGSQSVGQY